MATQMHDQMERYFGRLEKSGAITELRSSWLIRSTVWWYWFEWIHLLSFLIPLFLFFREMGRREKKIIFPLLFTPFCELKCGAFPTSVLRRDVTGAAKQLNSFLIRMKPVHFGRHYHSSIYGSNTRGFKKEAMTKINNKKLIIRKYICTQ